MKYILPTITAIFLALFLTRCDPVPQISTKQVHRKPLDTDPPLAKPTYKKPQVKTTPLSRRERIIFERLEKLKDDKAHRGIDRDIAKDYKHQTTPKLKEALNKRKQLWEEIARLTKKKANLKRQQPSFYQCSFRRCNSDKEKAWRKERIHYGQKIAVVQNKIQEHEREVRDIYTQKIKPFEKKISKMKTTIEAKDDEIKNIDIKIQELQRLLTRAKP